MLGSGDLSDEEFLRQMVLAEFPAKDFHHEDHLRLAWLCLREGGNAEHRMCELIRHFAEANGATRKFHLTMTLAWVRLVAMAGAPSFEEVMERFPQLRDKELLREFYSRESLGSERARGEWVKPDLGELGLRNAGRG